MNLAMKVVKDPDRLIDAVGGLWAAYLAVLATLRLEFARVTAMALGIAEMIKFPIVRVAGPPLSALLGPERKHWVMTIITVVLNLLVISFAWFLQKVISAFNSALRGGKMFGEALLAYLNENGLLAKVPCLKTRDDGTLDLNETYLDEIIGYLVAAGPLATHAPLRPWMPQEMLICFCILAQLASSRSSTRDSRCHSHSISCCFLSPSSNTSSNGKSWLVLAPTRQ